MRNPLHSFYRWLHFILYEERDDPYAPNRKKHRVLHNIHIIQAWAAMTIIIGLPLAVFSVTILITIPYFVIGYLIFCLCAAIFLYGGRYYEHHMNDSDFRKQPSSCADLNAEIR